MKVDKLSKYSRPIVASLLVSSGLLQLAAPVLAEGTAAGTQITNTATASYEDPTDPNKPLNTYSNTVKVAVAEVAGLTLTADTTTVVDGATSVPTNAGAVVGNKVWYDFVVTNVGNDTTKIRIPGTATVTTGAGSVDKVQYFDGTTWVDIPNAGEFISTAKAPGETLKVRVVTTVLAGAVPGDDLAVTLGNTLTPNAQNVLRDSTGGDVYTIDNEGGAGDVVGAPENGVREAAATQKVVIGASPEAFATITKTHGTQNPGADPAILTDDTLTYDLSLKVASQAEIPTGSTKSAADLEPTTINLGQRVLVSDAVPAGTTAKSLTVPAGWEAVYTLSNTTAVPNASAATWVVLPVNAANVATVPAGATRVGFIKAGSVTKGTTVTGMKVTVEFTTIPATGGTILNIAQVFGSTNVNGTAKPVYDESGDNKPNNYNDNNTPGAVDAGGNPIVGTGIVDPATTGIDTGNDNTGTGAAGEANSFTVSPIAQAGILNGTSNTPGAVGPAGNNDDFTNVSAAIPAPLPGDITGAWTLDANGNYVPGTVNPSAAPFANTLESATTANVNLVPTSPAVPLPAGTKVTITYGSTSKTYVYVVDTANPANNKFVDDVAGATTTTPVTPLVVAATAGVKLNYGVEVDLPSVPGEAKGYGVPITAYIGNALTSTTPQNTTIDRVYTGYLKLTKEAQILDADGSIIQDFTTSPTKNARPGQMIQYRITYRNISEIAPANSGSIALNAQKIAITEDGNLAGSTSVSNNWATNTTHKAGSAIDSNNGQITFDNGASSNSSANVAVYKDVVAGPLAAQTEGNFRFTRIVK
jgi:hypothetical protein